jgi:response regulator RpfG family c-di-GMP phosphodiesterase
MCIMAVDAGTDSLTDISKKLRAAFPKSEIVTFENSLDALKFGETHSIDILFTDVRLKPFDGYELIKALRRRQSFRAYIVSGSRERPDDFEWMNVNGCFSKPVFLSELMEIARRERA